MGDRRTALSFHQQATATAGTRLPADINLAYQLLGSAVVVDPTFAHGLFDLGNANGDMNLLPAAVACFRRSLQEPVRNESLGDLTPELKAKALTNLGWRLHHLGKNDEAHEAIDAAIQADENLAYAWNLRGMLCSTDGDHDVAIACTRRAFEMAPQDSVVQTSLGFCLMHAGQYAEGLRHFEARFPYRLRHFLQYPYPQWNGSENKTLMLVADQGIGDTLSFCRFVEAAVRKSKYTHMCVQKELVRLFAAMFGHLKNLDIVPLPCPFPVADAWTTFVSLPVALNLTTEQIIEAPNPRVPVFTEPALRRMPDRKFHVGIAWAGSPANDINHWRSVPFDLFLELYRVPGIQLYGFQVGERARDLHDRGAGALVVDLSPSINDVADTLSLLRDLDLVICCESALGHICGIVEKECWVAYSRHGRDYRANDERALWNPRHRIFRQGEDARWEPVFDRIVDALKERVG